eukprot:CAMPEP_0172673448 /NCGR_PEP_ID=MMETSP1074-20121228/12151_1 /TAXON_ID=2916 /ORGANISM="Ceratium fusus, Strain PA161109" /LENGTH=530 /DNA_ID=CAMNT_0013490749 /DNA_START=50 /DNA_END=1642 /DNA_ORIENTATION=+
MALPFSELSGQLWLVLVVILFNSFKYFTLATVLTSFATNEYGVSDVQAGSLYGVWGLCHTIWGFVGSLAVDRYGIRKVALVATFTGVISRGLLVFFHSERIMQLVLCGLGPLSEGVCDPLYMVAIKKLTKRRVRAFAFGLQYAFMNLGGAFGENLIDCVRLHTWMMPWGQEYSGLRFCLFLTWFAAVIGWLFAMQLRDPPVKLPPHWSPVLESNTFNQQASAGYVALLYPSPASTASGPSSPGQCCSPASSPSSHEPCEIVIHTEDARAAPQAPPRNDILQQMADVDVECDTPIRVRVWDPLRAARVYVADDAFQRAVFMTAAVMFVSLQWKYMDTLLPKFADRTFGASCPWATIYSINSWMCVICPPLISALTPGDQVDDFWLILPGLWIMALSPLTIWASVSQPATALWVVLLSCGEVMWSPRSQSFIASLAPEGREGVFLALAGLPTFLSQYPVGLISGWLLDNYCPQCPSNDNQSCTLDPEWQADPAAMWLWVAATSAVSPILVAVALGYLRTDTALLKSRCIDDC